MFFVFQEIPGNLYFQKTSEKWLKSGKIEKIRPLFRRLFRIQEHPRRIETSRNRNCRKTQQCTKDAGPTMSHQNPIHPSPGPWPGDIYRIPISSLRRNSLAESSDLSTRPVRQTRRRRSSRHLREAVSCQGTPPTRKDTWGRT